VTSLGRPTDTVVSQDRLRDTGVAQGLSKKVASSRGSSRDIAVSQSRSDDVPIATFYLNPDPVTCSVSTTITRADPDALKNHSLASMPEMSELVIDPENTYTPRIPDFISDESDWESKSTISI
jgi:hypothetical protein